jgi:hypothetical protein
LDTSSTSSSSISSVCFTNDDENDSYATLNPYNPYPVLSLTRVSVSPQIVGLDDPVSSTTSQPVSTHLIDTGGNFNMTNCLDLLVNVVAIKPFDIGMAAQEARSTSR